MEQPTPKHDHEEDDQIYTYTKWDFVEQKSPTSKDKDLLIILTGVTIVAIAIMLKMYLFGALIAMATSVFTYLGRREPKTCTFYITNVGIFMNNDFIPRDRIHAFNIIDKPGETAQLIIHTEKIISMNEILPIYDVSMKRIRSAFRRINVVEDTSVRPNILDIVADVI